MVKCMHGSDFFVALKIAGRGQIFWRGEFIVTLAPPVKNWSILLEQSFTACTPLLMATSTFRLGRRC